MGISRYSIGNRFVGQPVIFSTEYVPDVIVDGLSAGEGWTVRDSVRDNVLPKVREFGLSNMILAQERDGEGWDIPKIADIAAYLRESGVTSWWYGWGIKDTAVCGELRDASPDRWAEWLKRVRAFKLPVGVNFAYDIYRQYTESGEAWFVNRSELARALILALPNARILPIVWHRFNSAPLYPLKPVGLFRAELRWAVQLHGRVRWWPDPIIDAGEAWDPHGTNQQSRYQLAFCEEAGVAA